MLNDNTPCGIGLVEVIRACAKLEYPFAIDPRQPEFSELFLDFLSVVFGRHSRKSYFASFAPLREKSSVKICESIFVCNPLMTRPGKIPR